jgi:signal transduction histidine kinase
MNHERQTRSNDTMSPSRVPAMPTVRQGQAPRFCALVARVLGCRRCWITLAGADGNVLIEDSLDEWQSPESALSDPAVTAGSGEGFTALRSNPSPFLPPEGTGDQAFIWLPVLLPGGTSGVVSVADRVDGRPFGPKDLELLDQLVRFYVTTYDDTTWREVRRLRGELKDMRRQATNVAERERDRLSRELHDDIGHAITTAILGLDIKAQAFRAGSPGRKAIVAAREVLVDCADHVHAFAFHLRPRVLTDLGFVPAVRGLARRVRETTNVAVEVSVEGREHRLGEETELTAFRVVQEAITNALKHARATLITVSVAYTEFGLEVEVRDDGKGFAKGNAAANRGLSGQGLAGMRERVQLVGGVLEIESQGGVGTAIWTRLPFVETEPC